MRYLLYRDRSLDGLLSVMMVHYKALYEGLSDVVVIPHNKYGHLPLLRCGDKIMFLSVSECPEKIENLVNTKAVEAVVVDHHTQFVEEVGYEFIDWMNLPYFTMCETIDDDMLVNICDCGNLPKVGWRYYFANNEVEGKLNEFKRSSCGIVYDVIKEKSPEFLPFLNTFMRGELDRLVNLTQNHELWLHEGNRRSDAIYLNSWYKAWDHQHRHLVEKMLQEPEESYNIMTELKASFFSTNLETKLAIGKRQVFELKRIMDDITNSSMVKKVHLGPYASKDLSICYLDGVNTLDISPTIVGNFLVKDYGWDIAIIDMLIENTQRVCYLYSNPDGADIDVLNIAEALCQDGYGVGKDGRPNAAVLYPNIDKLPSFVIPA